MALEQDDVGKAIEEAGIILDSASRIFPVRLPLGTAYDLGGALAMEAASIKEVNEEVHESAIELLKKFEAVVPVELIRDGREGFPGDLNIEVEIPLRQSDVEFVGQTLLALPSGRQIIEHLPIDPNDRAELEGFRNQHFRSFLLLCDTFVEAGGAINLDTRRAIEESLS